MHGRKTTRLPVLCLIATLIGASALMANPALANPPAALGGGLRELVESFENKRPNLAAQLRLHLTDELGEPLARIRPARAATGVAYSLAEDDVLTSCRDVITSPSAKGYPTPAVAKPQERADGR